jgi:sugar-phosphatase
MQLATTGLRLDAAVLMWRSFFPDLLLDADRLRVRLLELAEGAVKESGQAKPGALQALDICRKAGLPMAVASSSAPVMIEAALERLGVKEFFRAAVSAEGLSHGKPHPAVYLEAAAKLGVEPENCLAFEDSVFGLQSAKAAGMYCIAVPEEHNRGRPEYAIADRILVSLEDFKADALLV